MEMASMAAPMPMPSADATGGDPSRFAPMPPSYEASEARHGAAEQDYRNRPEKTAAAAAGRAKASKPPRETKGAPAASKKPKARTAKEAERRPK